MNHYQRNREIAINFEILRKLVKDDARLNQLITRDRFLELQQVSEFYFNHCSASRFIQDYPKVLQMMQRETVSAFTKLLPNTKIISKFDEEYPASLLQNLKDDAPLFIYACGNIALLGRKHPKVVLTGSRSANEKEMIHAKELSVALAQKGYVVTTGFDDLLDTSAQAGLQEAGLSGMTILHIPLVKSFVEGSLDTSIKRQLFRASSLVISPFPPTQTALLKSESELVGKMLASIGKVSVVLSAKEGGSAHREAGYCVAMHKPVILPKYILMSLKFIESKYIFSTVNDEELMELIRQFA